MLKHANLDWKFQIEVMLMVFNVISDHHGQSNSKGMKIVLDLKIEKVLYTIAYEYASTNIIPNTKRVVVEA